MKNATNSQELSVDWKELAQQTYRTLSEIKFDKNKLNILVIGKSGAGKSTLINAVFGKDFAKTGSGKPVTQKLKKFQKGDLSIYDSKGLELQDDDAYEEIVDFIDTQKNKACG